MQEIASGVFIETDYDGVNVAAILTDEGVVCIDLPSYPRDARDWVNRVNRLHGRGPRYLILTDYHGDRILNTRWLSVPIIASQATADRIGTYDRRYPQALIDSLAQRNPLLGRELASGPVDQVSVSFTGTMSFHCGRHVFDLVHKPGPNAGSIWVNWPDAGVLFTGDSFVNGVLPPLNEMLIFDWIESLSSFNLDEFGTVLLLPGRGEPCGPAAPGTMLAFLQLIQSMVNQHIAEDGNRQDVLALVPEIMAQVPSDEFAPDWTKREIGLGLMRTYDQILATLGVSLPDK